MGGSYRSWILEPQRKKYVTFLENPSFGSKVVILGKTNARVLAIFSCERPMNENEKEC